MTTQSVRWLVVALLLGGSGAQPAGALGVARSPGAPLTVPTQPADADATPSAAAQCVVQIEVAGARASGCFVRSGEVVTAADALKGRDVVRLTTVDGRMGLGSVVARDRSGLALLTVHASLSPTTLVGLGTPQGGEGSLLRLVRRDQADSPTGRVSGTPSGRSSFEVDMEAVLSPADLGAPLVDQRGRLVGVVVSAEGRAAVAVSASSVDALLAKPRQPAPSRAVGAAARPPEPSRAPAPASPATPVEEAELSETDAMRLDGERALDRAFSELAGQAESAAARQEDYETDCVGQYVQVVGCWWMSWDYCVVEKTELPECIDQLAAVERLKASVRGGIAEAEERARRAGVYPGVMRDLRARHGLDRLPF